ncbi:MAG: SPASM domain-containing protein [Chlorobiaceae bacterium]|nr:SPASM domain-containing protein [Chlorobiaceae bacterium]
MMAKDRFWEQNYSSRVIDGKVLLTAVHGAWAIIGRRQFANLDKRRAGKKLLRELEEKGLIHTVANSGDLEKRLGRWKSTSMCGTTLHIVVATRRCNLQCDYCHASASGADSSGEDLAPEMGRRITDFILATPASQLTIEFQGGEPFLNFAAIRDVIEYAEAQAPKVGKKVAFAIVSNFTLLSPDILSFVEQHDISLCTSVDGPPALHDLHRHFPSGKGSHDLVRSNLELAAGRLKSIGVLTVLSNQSLKHYREIIDMYVQMGRDELCVNPVQQIGHARDHWDSLGIEENDDFLAVYRDILDYTFELLKGGTFIMDRMFLLALSKVTHDVDVSYMDFRSPCGAVIGQLVYDINGDIYPCDEARTFPELKIGHVLEDTYEDILGSSSSMSVFEASLHTDPLCEDCAYKPYCGICPVVSYAESGSLRLPASQDPRCHFSLFLFDYLFNKLITSPEDITAVLRYQHTKNALMCVQETGSDGLLFSPACTDISSAKVNCREGGCRDQM